MKDAIGRGATTVADQALSSVTNFAVALVVARELGARELGAFSVGFATYLIALAASRALATDPLMIRFSGIDTYERRRADGASVGAALMVGLVAGGCCAIAAVALAEPLRGTLFALALVMPGLLLQDAWRFVFFSRGRPSAAVANDGCWALVQIGLMALVIAGTRGSAALFLGAWGLAAGTAGLVGCAQARLLPSRAGARAWLRVNRRLSLPLLGEYATNFAGIYAAIFLVAALRGLAAAGSLRAALTLVGPLSVMFLGLCAAGVAEGVRLLRHRPERLAPAMRGLSAFQGVVAISWTIVLMLAPDDLGRLLLGQNWARAQEVLLPVALYVLATGLTLGAVCGLRALGATRTSFRARLALVPATVLGCVGGTIVYGARGAAIGLACANAIGVVVWWAVFTAASRRLREPNAVRLGSELPAAPTPDSCLTPAVAGGAG